MLLRVPQQSLDEIRQTIQARAKPVRARTDGRLALFSLKFGDEDERERSAIIWVLRAHIGMLDKIEGLFVREGEYQTFELLAIARNLFENLIWLRLFKREPLFGLVFYEQLLVQQAQNTREMIVKLEGEASLFDDYGRMDSDNIEAAFADVIGLTDSSDEMLAEAQEKHEALTAELDMRARRSFALYAAAAQFNSYEYQSHILRNDVIPKHRETLADIEARLARYQSIRDQLLGPAMSVRARARWNWKDRAEDVEMGKQYAFLYSYTSKLLHSTPMNLITEKSLSDSEAVAMLEYAFVTIHDLFDEIETFSASGLPDAIAIHI